jgi:hypothetical protein
MTEEERKARKRAANHKYHLTHKEQNNRRSREWARRQPDYAEKATERTIIEVDRKENGGTQFMFMNDLNLNQPRTSRADMPKDIRIELLRLLAELNGYEIKEEEQ